MEILKQISEYLQDGNAPKVKELVKIALEKGFSPKDILQEGLLAGMDVIGIKFKNNEIYVPEVLIAARAMNAGMEVLKPVLSTSGVRSLGKVVIGTVKDDLHDIGKNLVKMMMEGAGFEVIDLGVDVSAEKFIEAIKENKPDILAMSALLTTTMSYMKTVIDALEKEGLRNQVKILIGGAPITEDYANKIGADKYAPDAASAADACKQLIKC